MLGRPLDLESEMFIVWIVLFESLCLNCSACCSTLNDSEPSAYPNPLSFPDFPLTFS